MQNITGTGFVVNGSSHAWYSPYSEVTAGVRFLDIVSGASHALYSPRRSNHFDGTRVQAGVTDTIIMGLDYAAAAPILIAGNGTYIHGQTAAVVDTGNGTVYIDTSNLKTKLPKFFGNVAASGKFLRNQWVDGATLPATSAADAGGDIYDAFHALPLTSDGSSWRTAAGVLHVQP